MLENNLEDVMVEERDLKTILDNQTVFVQYKKAITIYYRLHETIEATNEKLSHKIQLNPMEPVGQEFAAEIQNVTLFAHDLWDHFQDALKQNLLKIGASEEANCLGKMQPYVRKIAHYANNFDFSDIRYDSTVTDANAIFSRMPSELPLQEVLCNTLYVLPLYDTKVVWYNQLLEKTATIKEELGQKMDANPMQPIDFDFAIALQNFALSATSICAELSEPFMTKLSILGAFEEMRSLSTMRTEAFEICQNISLLFDVESGNTTAADVNAMLAPPLYDAIARTEL